MGEVPPDELLTGAELRLYKHASDVIDTNATLILNIYNIVPGHNEGLVHSAKKTLTWNTQH